MNGISLSAELWRAPGEGQPRLDDTEVHIWCLGIDAFAPGIDDLRTILSADELERAERFVSEEHQMRFVAARGKLRLCLSRYLGVQAEEIEFEYGTNGKPSVRDSSLRFNLSHSGDFALCAVASGFEIGIDIEMIHPLHLLDKIARRHFSPGESGEILSLPEPGRTERFFFYWTRKEALVKAIGEGIFVSLPLLDTSPAERSSVLFPPNGSNASRWSLVSFEPRPGYFGALAARKEVVKLGFFSFED